MSYRCPFCGRDYDTLYVLAKHVSKEHSRYCPVCGKEYSRLAQHAYREAVHRGCVLHKVLYILLSRKGKRIHPEWRDEVREFLDKHYRS